MTDINYYKIWLLENMELKAILSTLFVFLSDFSGVPLALIYCMFGVTALDLLLGMYRARKTKTYQQFKMNRGLFKFVMYGVCIGMMSVVDLSISNGIHTEINFFSEWTVSLVILTEISSSIDHMKALNWPVPDFILLFAKGAKAKVMGKATEFMKTKEEKRQDKLDDFDDLQDFELDFDDDESEMKNDKRKNK